MKYFTLINVEAFASFVKKSGKRASGDLRVSENPRHRRIIAQILLGDPTRFGTKKVMATLM